MAVDFEFGFWADISGDSTTGLGYHDRLMPPSSMSDQAAFHVVRFDDEGNWVDITDPAGSSITLSINIRRLAARDGLRMAVADTLTAMK